MKRSVLASGIFGLALASSSAVFAGPNEQAKIALHLTPINGAGCDSPGAHPPCSAIRTNGVLYPALYFAYLLVVDGNAAAGIGAMHCGVTYNAAAGSGMDVFSWTLCGDLELQRSGWPYPGGGNTIAWDATTRCQRIEPGGVNTGVVACAGYFYCGSKSSDVFSITPNPFTGIVFVRDCSAVYDTLDSPTAHRFPSALGFATFNPHGSPAGYNPCGLTTGVSGVPEPSVQARTWSGIKHAYSGDN